MDKGYLLKLTQAVYRVTDGFPEAEPLKFKIREIANEILTNLVMFNPTGQEKILKEVEVLENYFEIARIQNWVNPLNFLILGQEYSKIKELIGDRQKEKIQSPITAAKKETKFIAKEPAKTEKKTLQVIERSPGQETRHQKILETLKEKGKVQVWEIKQVLPEVSKRTLRRDFDYLLKQGKIERIGQRNNTSYQLKGIGHIEEIGQEADVLL